MRILILLILLLAQSVLLFEGYAAAQEEPGEVVAGTSGGAITFAGSSFTDVPGGSGGDALATSARYGEAPPPELVGLAPMTGVLPGGGACLGTVSSVFGTAEQAQSSTYQTILGNDAVARTPVCPPAAAVAGAPVVQVSPEQVALSFWRQADLPVPEPYVAPGWAITGKTAYLEANSEPAAQFAWSIPGFGVLVVDARAELVVDWGDGRGPQSYDSVGGPWPDGDVTNVYGDVGLVDIVVTQQWTADWSLGTATGTLGGLQTSGAIEDFEVRQIQAVIG